jgi:inorganic pyrophosphatase
MTAAALIQVLMREDNIDKDIVVVNVRNSEEFAIEEANDISGLLKLVVDLGDPDDACEHFNICNCDCESCEECLG